MSFRYIGSGSFVFLICIHLLLSCTQFHPQTKQSKKTKSVSHIAAVSSRAEQPRKQEIAPTVKLTPLKWEPQKSTPEYIFTEKGTTCWRDGDNSIWCMGAYWGKPYILPFNSEFSPSGIDYQVRNYEGVCFIVEEQKQFMCWPHGNFPLPEALQKGVIDGGSYRNINWAITKAKQTIFSWAWNYVFNSPVQLAYSFHSVQGVDDKGAVITQRPNRKKVIQALNGSIRISANKHEVCGIDKERLLTCVYHSDIWNESQKALLTVGKINDFSSRIGIQNEIATCATNIRGELTCWKSSTREQIQLSAEELLETIFGYYRYSNDVLNFVNGVSGKLYYFVSLDSKQPLKLTNFPASEDVAKIDSSESQLCILSKQGNLYCTQRCVENCNMEQLLTSLSKTQANVMDFSLADEHGCSILNNFKVFCWGNNHLSEMGTPPVTRYPKKVSRGLPLYYQDESGDWLVMPQTEDASAVKVADDSMVDFFTNYDGAVWGLGKDGYLYHKNIGCDDDFAYACYGEPFPDYFDNNNNESLKLQHIEDKTKTEIKWIRLPKPNNIVDFAGSVWGVDMLTANGELWRWSLSELESYEGWYDKFNGKNIKSIPSCGCRILKDDTLHCEQLIYHPISYASNKQWIETTKAVKKAVIAFGEGCLLKNDGTVWCFGDQITKLHMCQDKNVDCKLKPYQIPGLNEVVDIGVIVDNKNLEVNGCACALKSDGTVWCWNSVRTYCVGVMDEVKANIPVKVKGIENVEKLIMGHNHVCVIANKEMFCWGANVLGPFYSDKPIEVKY